MNQKDPYSDQDYPELSPGQSGPGLSPDGTRVMVSLPQVRPTVTYVLLGITVFAFILQVAGQYLLGTDLLAEYFIKLNPNIAQGEFWRLITPIFLHGSILHIGFNMYALFILGPGLERFYGHWRFLALYMVSGFAGNVFSMIFTPNPSLGASTAIFGLLAAQGVFFLMNRRVLGRMSQRALINIVLVAGVNFLISGLNPGIDNWGHLGGFIGGGMFAYLGGPLLDVRASYPGYELRDLRSSQSGLISTIVVAGFFAFLAIMVMYVF